MSPEPDNDPTIREVVAELRADVRWLKYLVLGTFVATAGQYLGLNGTVAEAVSRHLP